MNRSLLIAAVLGLVVSSGLSASTPQSTRRSEYEPDISLDLDAEEIARRRKFNQDQISAANSKRMRRAEKRAADAARKLLKHGARK